ncbi:MAG: peptidoglycan-associated lipoprotein Pal [Burkholderiales bacterium]|jgi:peptidoglycan-associated lipoprotein|nr:peptidoglycan-associated lipoprotein Pal [Burkholderiales bacterium]
MKNILVLLAVSLLVAACGSQEVKPTPSTAVPVESRDLRKADADAAEAARQAQLEREAAARAAAEAEARRRQEEIDAAATKSSPTAGGSEKPLAGGTLGPAALRDPSSPVYKKQIYYAYDSFSIDDQYRDVVEAHARFLLDNKGLKVRIEGNCDERGSTEYNLALGQRRADGVKRALTVLGVPAARIEAVSYGEEKPKALGHDEDSYSENRRSDLSYPDVK